MVTANIRLVISISGHKKLLLKYFVASFYLLLLQHSRLLNYLDE